MLLLSRASVIALSKQNILDVLYIIQQPYQLEIVLYYLLLFSSTATYFAYLVLKKILDKDQKSKSIRLVNTLIQIYCSNLLLLRVDIRTPSKYNITRILYIIQQPYQLKAVLYYLLLFLSAITYSACLILEKKIAQRL